MKRDQPGQPLGNRRLRQVYAADRNVGGATGSILLGMLTRKYNVRGLVIGALFISAVMVSIFGMGQSRIIELSIIGAATGFFTNSAVVGLYALFAQSFPTEVRAGGTGFVIGVGRGGAALGPVVAGILFEAGYGLQLVALFMAAGSVIAALAILILPVRGQIVTKKAAIC